MSDERESQWRGRALSELSRDELVEALTQTNRELVDTRRLLILERESAPRPEGQGAARS